MIKTKRRRKNVKRVNASRKERGVSGYIKSELLRMKAWLDYIIILKVIFFSIFYKYLESIVPSNDAIPKYSKCIVITRRYITSMIKQLLFCEKNWLRENMLIVLQI